MTAGAEEAYTDENGRYPNMGTSCIDNGILRVELACPQPYYEGGRIWPPHFHYVEQAGEGWSPKVSPVAASPGRHSDSGYAMTCLTPPGELPPLECTILEPVQVETEWNELILINALPKEYSDLCLAHPDQRATRRCYRQRNSIHVPYNCRDEMLRNMSATVGNHPYVVYCMNPRCKAASKLLLRLVAAGCCNAFYMPKGIEGWPTASIGDA